MTPPTMGDDMGDGNLANDDPHYQCKKDFEELRNATIMLCYRTGKMGCDCGTCDCCELAKMLLDLR